MRRPIPGTRVARNQRGATLVIVTLLLFVFLGIAALAIDLGRIHVIKNELQNAADAGALAGAQVLYMNNGEQVNDQANRVAFETATGNKSNNLAVEVNWTAGTNLGDVQRGHWRFADRTFTPNDSLAPVSLANVSEEDLDANPDFINAVRVVARREETPAAFFFAQVLGFKDLAVTAEAVAYDGFAGTLGPHEIDQPLAICQDSILNDSEEYSCNIGRMINSGSDPASSNTAGWTSFEQTGESCSAASANEVKPLVCAGGNPDSIQYGESMAATGGELESVFKEMRDCWHKETNGHEPWEMTLTVAECSGNNIGNCPTVVGAVTVNMLWMTESGTAKPEDAPERMESPNPDIADWNFNDSAPDQCSAFRSQIGNPTPTALSHLNTTAPGFGDPGRWQGESTYTEGMARWDCFVNHFQLKNADDGYAPLAKKSMYFMPDCTPHEPIGVTGGNNFGVLARIPVLVQ